MDLTNCGSGAMNAHGYEVIGRDIFRDGLTHFADEIGRDAVDAEGDKIFDGKALSEERVDFLW